MFYIFCLLVWLFFCLILKKDDVVILKDFTSFAWPAFVWTERSIREVITILQTQFCIICGIHNQLEPGVEVGENLSPVVGRWQNAFIGL